LTGRYPARGASSHRRDWTTAAEAIRDYRQAHGITDREPEQALGKPPSDLRQRAAWRQVIERIDRVHGHHRAQQGHARTPGRRAAHGAGQDRELA
jgi:hypothetical protein